MKFVCRLQWLAVAVVAVAGYGCNEDTSRPDPPPPPPSISLQPFTMGNGLPSNEVYDVMVDSQGRTWFSTNAGVGLRVGDQPLETGRNSRSRYPQRISILRCDGHACEQGLRSRHYERRRATDRDRWLAGMARAAQSCAERRAP